MTTQDRWIAAVHEAGHAVTAFKLGYELKEVSIRNAYRCCLRPVLADQPPSGIETLTDAEDRCDALYTLAGGKAELELLDTSEEQLSASDRDYFRTLGPQHASRQELEEWCCSCELAAERLVRRHRKAIIAVANALRDKGRLAHAEVRRLVENA